MNNNEWLYTFFKDKYKITITQEIIREDLLGSIIKLSVPEVAYLLISISEHYGITVDNIMGYISSGITYDSLAETINVLSK